MKTATARDQRNENVRLRIEAAIGQSLRQVGHDYILPDNRRVVICYSRFHPLNAYFYLGLPSRLLDNDILVLLLGDKHLVFPRAETLLRYKDSYPRSGEGARFQDFRFGTGNSYFVSLQGISRSCLMTVSTLTVT